MNSQAQLLDLALDLGRSLADADRYQRFIDITAQIIPADAVCLLARSGDVFVPLAARGLSPDALGRHFRRQDHPRLHAVAAAPSALEFPFDSRLPDPFDGLLVTDATALATVHSCLGIPLRVDDELVGIITADSLQQNAFSGLPPSLLSWLGALAGAALRTTRLIEKLESSTQRLGLITEDLMRSAEQHGGIGLLGTSPPMQRLRDEIALVAPSNMTVLITGETGTGKELVARALHRASGRANRPLFDLNCAALPSSLAESELFGHVRGAFTGAERDRTGKLELADGATLLLDELGELPLGLQAKLLRTLQEGEVQRVGADRSLHVDVRFLAATNRDLEALVQTQRFREDLYHRLNVFRLQVPPLRERGEDVYLLAGHFCEQARLRLGLGPVRLSPETRAELGRNTWPGNVRELENTLQRAILRASRGVVPGQPVIVRGEHLTGPGAGIPIEPAASTPGPQRSLPEQVDEFRRRLIQQALARSSGNWSKAAKELGLDRGNLHHLAARLGLR